MLAVNFLFFNDLSPEANAQSAREFLRRNRMLERVSRVVIVNNADTGCRVMPLDARTTYTSGDNTFTEFSGWDVGLRCLGSLGRDETGVLFANDTVLGHGRLHVAQWFEFRGGMERLCRDPKPARVLAGWRDKLIAAPGVMTPLGTLDDGHINTKLFFVSQELLEALGSLVPPREMLGLLEKPSEANSWSYIRAAGWERYNAELRIWLNQPGSPGSWYRSAPLASDNADSFFRKATAIYCEHLLTLRARKLSAATIDFRTDSRALYAAFYFPRMLLRAAKQLRG
jgi:hypothetical protein